MKIQDIHLITSEHFLTCNPTLNHTLPSNIDKDYNTTQQNQNIQQHYLNKDDKLLSNISISTISTDSNVDVINPHNIESYVDKYNNIHSTQKKTTTKINNNNTQNKIRNNNNEHNNTSTNVVNNVNLTAIIIM